MPPERIPRQRVGRYPLDVFRVEDGDSHFVRTLSSEYHGLFTHYVKPAKRSYYCKGDKCDCTNSRFDRVWKGYCSIEVWSADLQHWAPAVLEVTEALEICFRGKFDRAQTWELWRLKGTKQKPSYPVQGRFIEQIKDEVLPDPYPVRPVLMRLYHCPDGIELHHKNPMPLPEMVEPSKGKAPGGLPRTTEKSDASHHEWEEFQRKLRERTGKIGGNGHTDKGGGS